MIEAKKRQYYIYGIVKCLTNFIPVDLWSEMVLPFCDTKEKITYCMENYLLIDKMADNFKSLFGIFSMNHFVL